MTAGTGANNMRMIHRAGLHGRPRCWPRLMTRIARIGGINMIATLTRGNAAIMTTGASTDYLRVINAT
jgi:hypothetical protein